MERETKTKAYSKEGLAQVEKLDPEQQKRADSRKWVEDLKRRLEQQTEELEAEVEEMSSTKRGRQQNSEEIQNKEQVMQDNKWHCDQMDVVIRLLDNDELEADQVDELQEDLEYYFETNTTEE